MKDNLKDKAMIGKAIYRISEIPEGIEYTDECWVKIYKARSAYDSVKADKRDLVYNLPVLLKAESEFNACVKKEEEKNRLAANQVINKINEILESIGYIPEYHIKVNEAKSAYEVLTKEQRNLAGNYYNMSESEKKSLPIEVKDVINKFELSINARNAKIDKIKEFLKNIRNLSQYEIKISEARSAYDALTKKQKDMVDNYYVLLEAEKNLLSVEFEAFINKIREVPENIEYTPECKAKLKEVNLAFKALTKYKRNYILRNSLLTEVITLLRSEFDACVKKAREEENRLAANQVINKINEILESIGYIPEYHTKKNEMKSAYEVLTKEQRNLAGNYYNMSESEKKSLPIEVKDVINKFELSINARNAKIDKIKEFLKNIRNLSQYEIKISEARSAYDALTKKQKDMVDNYYVLLEAEKNLLSVEFEAFINKIREVPENMEYTPECKAKVDEINLAYDILTKSQEEYIFRNSLLIEAITLLETEFDACEKKEEEKNRLAANQVINKIKEIPDSIKYTSECKEKINAAIVAYNDLTTEQKQLVHNHCELVSAINALKDSKKALNAAELEKLYMDISYYPIDEILQVAKTIGLRVVSATDIRKLNKSKDLRKLLKALQQKNMEAVDRSNLVNEDINGQIVDNNMLAEAVINKIKEMSLSIESISECRTKIYTARSAYNALTLEQKKLVYNYSVLELAECTFED